LARLRTIHPVPFAERMPVFVKGKIIAVDLGIPSYLGDEDFIIQEDLQYLIPSVANKILKLI